MAVSSVISRVCDLNKPLIQENLDHILVMGDSQGDQFDVVVSHGNNPQSLTGGGVIGYFIRIESGKKIEDSDTVMITGSASGNIATVILPESCYSKPGRFVLTIKVTLEGRRHTVYIANGAIARSTTDSILDPGHVIPDINELLSYISALETAIDNAKKAITSAEQATANANTAASKAETATANANTATASANEAATKANLGASIASDAAAKAVGATEKANTASDSANAAATKANSAADRVDTSINSANTAASNANKAAGDANTAASKANDSATKASSAATEATQAATIAKKWENVEVSVTILPENGTAKCVVTDTQTGKRMSFDIPRGYSGVTPNLTIGKVETGLPGTNVEVTMTGTKENPVLNLKIPRGDTGVVENLPYASNTPLPSEKQGKVGTSDRVAREDHIHPIPSSLVSQDELEKRLESLDIPEAPVTSVNGMTGDVTLDIPTYIGTANYIAKDYDYPEEKTLTATTQSTSWCVFPLSSMYFSSDSWILDSYNRLIPFVFSIDLKLESGTPEEDLNIRFGRITEGNRTDFTKKRLLVDKNSFSSEYKRYVIVDTLDLTTITANFEAICLRLQAGDSLKSSDYLLSIRRPKLQLGNIETDWSPSIDNEANAKLSEEDFQKIVNAVLNEFPSAEGVKF